MMKRKELKKKKGRKKRIRSRNYLHAYILKHVEYEYMGQLFLIFFGI